MCVCVVVLRYSVPLARLFDANLSFESCFILMYSFPSASHTAGKHVLHVSLKDDFEIVFLSSRRKCTCSVFKSTTLQGMHRHERRPEKINETDRYSEGSLYRSNLFYNYFTV